MRVIAVIFAIAVPLLLMQGCGAKPWERGNLARASMDPASVSRVTAEDFVHHTFDVREGATGCSGHAGGGCGCN